MTTPDLSALRALVDRARKDHSPFDHDYVRDEKRCADCKMIVAARKALERVEETIAQLTRNEAYWRKRAENAEARLAQLEGRDE